MNVEDPELELQIKAIKLFTYFDESIEKDGFARVLEILTKRFAS